MEHPDHLQECCRIIEWRAAKCQNSSLVDLISAFAIISVQFWQTPSLITSVHCFHHWFHPCYCHAVNQMFEFNSSPVPWIVTYCSYPEERRFRDDVGFNLMGVMTCFIWYTEVRSRSHASEHSPSVKSLRYLCCHKGRLNSTNEWYSACLVVTVYR
jgi:hypothetical protein